jgi:hypothetical protein
MPRGVISGQAAGRFTGDVTELEVEANNFRRMVAGNGNTKATFVLKRPQPAILALIASRYTPIYPCHISPRDMPQHPIGTGPRWARALPGIVAGMGLRHVGGEGKV